MDDSAGEVTRLLAELQENNEDAAPKLFELLYKELRRLAQYHLGRECPGHTLQATALVHEAYLRLAASHPDWHNRAHFFAIASAAMRRVLVDHARAKHATKRNGGEQPIDLDDAIVLHHERHDDVIMLDRALDRLSRIDPQQVSIVELRYFGGLSAAEAAQLLGVSANTVQREWTLAKAWLLDELSGRRAAG